MGAVLERELRYKLISVLSLLGAAMAVVASVAVASRGGGVHSLVVRETVPVLALLTGYVVLSRRWHLPTGARWNRESARRVWTFGKGLFWIRALDQLSNRLDRLILGNLLSLDVLIHLATPLSASLPAALWRPATNKWRP